MKDNCRPLVAERGNVLTNLFGLHGSCVLSAEAELSDSHVVQDDVKVFCPLEQLPADQQRHLQARGQNCQSLLGMSGFNWRSERHLCKAIASLASMNVRYNCWLFYPLFTVQPSVTMVMKLFISSTPMFLKHVESKSHNFGTLINKEKVKQLQNKQNLCILQKMTRNNKMNHLLSQMMYWHKNIEQMIQFYDVCLQYFKNSWGWKIGRPELTLHHGPWALLSKGLSVAHTHTKKKPWTALMVLAGGFHCIVNLAYQKLQVAGIHIATVDLAGAWTLCFKYPPSIDQRSGAIKSQYLWWLPQITHLFPHPL